MRKKYSPLIERMRENIMELNYIVPNMEQTFGNLEFADVNALNINVLTDAFHLSQEVITYTQI